MTGKGERWGRDRLGRSAPAFLSANTFALPPTYLHGESRPTSSSGSGCFCCKAGQLVAVVCCEACAGRRIRWLCLPAVPCSAGFLFACSHLCLPCPLPFSVLAPVQLLCPVHFALLAPVHCHVRQDQQFVRASSLQAARTVPLAAATRACSGGPCTGPF